MSTSHSMFTDYPNAQIAFDNPTNWTIITPYVRWGDYKKNQPLPPVTCPIVTTANVTSDALFREAMRTHVSPAGVDDVDALIAKLERVGALVAYPVAIPEPQPVEAETLA